MSPVLGGGAGSETPPPGGTPSDLARPSPGSDAGRPLEEGRGQRAPCRARVPATLPQRSRWARSVPTPGPQDP